MFKVFVFCFLRTTYRARFGFSNSKRACAVLANAAKIWDQPSVHACMCVCVCVRACVCVCAYVYLRVVKRIDSSAQPAAAAIMEPVTANANGVEALDAPLKQPRVESLPRENANDHIEG